MVEFPWRFPEKSLTNEVSWEKISWEENGVTCEGLKIVDRNGYCGDIVIGLTTKYGAANRLGNFLTDKHIGSIIQMKGLGNLWSHFAIYLGRDQHGIHRMLHMAADRNAPSNS